MIRIFIAIAMHLLAPYDIRWELHRSRWSTVLAPYRWYRKAMGGAWYLIHRELWREGKEGVFIKKWMYGVNFVDLEAQRLRNSKGKIIEFEKYNLKDPPPDHIPTYRYETIGKYGQ